MKLYYIGNGFDLAHNLPTRYLDFKEYFKTNYPEYYYRFIEMYGLGEIHSDYNGPYYDDSESEEIIELWMDFENTLAKIDSSFIYNKLGTIQETRELTKSEFEGIFDPDPAWYNDIYVENMNLYELYQPLQKAFISWIESIEKNIFQLNQINSQNHFIQYQTIIHSLLYLITLIHYKKCIILITAISFIPMAKQEIQKSIQNLVMEIVLHQSKSKF